MKVLIGCETSGTVRNAFLEKGFDTWSCDILPADDQTNRHIQDDVRDVLKMEAWDLLMVAHPPCTRLCNSGVRWLHNPPEGKTVEEMWQELDEGTALFSDLWNADVPRIAIENPIMHKYAKSRIENFEPFTQSVQPYEFAESIDADDNVTKRTCLWLKNLPKLVKTGSLTKETARHDIHHASPGPDRWKVRSKFHVGLAKAMADQWGAVL
jgi:hypothetical protein|tara:strand:- start:234 stop:863 length:630 start_codon:yes stop_codon:yes gene_type:complete